MTRIPLILAIWLAPWVQDYQPPIAIGQDMGTPGFSVSGNEVLALTTPQSLMIEQDGELVVQIDLQTGAVKYGPKFDADSSAKIFWENLRKAYSDVCVAPPGKP